MMSIYGDRGNIICIKKRVEWRGREVVIDEYNVGDKKYNFEDVDLFFFGGGQDIHQIEVALDLKTVGKMINRQVVDKRAALLAICGGMQLLAKYYQPTLGDRIEGTGLFDAYTRGGKERFIGNVVVESEIGGEKNNLVGFENHSGRTYANWDNMKPLGKALIGRGNNGEDGTEGMVFQNAVGSYLHGSLLPKNPWLADWLIQKAFIRRYDDYQLEELNDDVEKKANEAAQVVAENVGKVSNISEV
ncbi:glutamine amidotransferase [Patescibacteria group bacterium]|nr:glutamine amidotransferase [Patescibacteria group bacterium]